MKKVYYREEVEMMMKSAIADEVRAIVKDLGHGGSYGDNLCVIDGMVRLADAVSQAMKENEKEGE